MFISFYFSEFPEDCRDDRPPFFVVIVWLIKFIFLSLYMDNNTTKRMTLKELVESGMSFTEIVECVRDRDFVRVSNSDPAKAIVPIQSKRLGE